MKALFFDTTLHLDTIDIPKPESNEALIKVSRVGICNTDLEIIKGYIPGYNGIIGHEFIGTLVNYDNPEIVGSRITT